MNKIEEGLYRIVGNFCGYKFLRFVKEQNSAVLISAISGRHTPKIFTAIINYNFYALTFSELNNGKFRTGSNDPWISRVPNSMDPVQGELLDCRREPGNRHDLLPSFEVQCWSATCQDIFSLFARHSSKEEALLLVR